MAKVFITGATGFLGSNIARSLIANGHDLAATYRSSSSKELCEDFNSQISWILQERDWENEVLNYEPEVIIHAAWMGVGHDERNCWEIQSANINFLQQVLIIAKTCNVRKFIGLGSQAEYGGFNGCITEAHATNPNEAYGCVKVVCAQLTNQFCRLHHIDWFWLRLFSVFGKGESGNWLIPALVNKLITTDQMDFTPGDQKYAYLYAEDLGVAIDNIINVAGRPGIYNISGKHPIKLKDLITQIRDIVNPVFKLNFGNLLYRENQPMLVQGDCSKFVTEFGDFDISDFNTSLNLTIGYVMEKLKRNQ